MAFMPWRSRRGTLSALSRGHRDSLPGQPNLLSLIRIPRGTRPLHMTATPDGRVFFGEYFDNDERDEVHIYTSRMKARRGTPPIHFRKVLFATSTTSSTTDGKIVSGFSPATMVTSAGFCERPAT